MRGKQDSILELLQERGSVGEALEQKIKGETDVEVLKKLLKLAGRSGSIAEFEAQLEEQEVERHDSEPVCN